MKAQAYFIREWVWLKLAILLIRPQLPTFREGTTPVLCVQASDRVIDKIWTRNGGRKSRLGRKIQRERQSELEGH